MPTPDTDCVVIGAGVVGLAIARALAQTGSVMVLEKAPQPATATSSRNSGVIHTGIYYPATSLKAQLCVQGQKQLYRYCAQHHIPHRRCGKLIVATNPAEQAALHDLHRQATANGVALAWWDRAQISNAEPAINADAALFSPDTGIIDTQALALALAADIARHGGDIVTHCEVERITPVDGGFELQTQSGGQSHTLCATSVINAAGLAAQTLATRTDTLAAHHIPALHRCKGDYFRFSKPSPLQHLVYPVANKNAAGLGIHATLDLHGGLRFGPDTQYINDDSVDAENYVVDEHKRELFCKAIQRYFPAIEAQDLVPDYAGIRPKLQAAGAPFCDFVISGPRQHGINRLINLFGIESPGLTAALAIADHVATLMQ